MKINPVLAIIALAISALAAYGFFAWNSGEPYQLLLAGGGGLTIFLPLSGLLAFHPGGRGTAGNIRALSVVFLLPEIIINVIFSAINVTGPTVYIIVNGILMLIYILIAYAISRALK
ncbi:MAG: hypothetical protein LBG42_05340 [Treponema sp.]|jgi:hypothetical protein|nr:hypothetical protein [Treponema sp.]